MALHFSLDNALSWVLLLSYAVLCAISLVQIAKIIIFRHDVYSFQFAFLTCCFVWTFLRAVFFSCHVIEWPVWVAALLYFFPFSFQVATNGLLVLFYAKIYYQHQWYRSRSFFIATYLVVVLIMTMVTILMSGLYSISSWQEQDAVEAFSILDKIYVVTSGLYHTVLVILAAYFVHKIYVRSRVCGSTVQPSPYVSVVLYTSAVFLLFCTRAIYDFVVAFCGTSLHVSGFADGVKLFVFVAFLLWEILPTLLILFYFRHIPRTRVGYFNRVFRKRSPSVRNRDRPPQLTGTVNSLGSDPWEQTVASHAVPLLDERGRTCFDDALRYDSDTEIAWKPSQ